MNFDTAAGIMDTRAPATIRIGSPAIAAAPTAGSPVLAPAPTPRQHELYELIIEHGDCAISALAQHFSVTPITIHRDLDLLERHGIVRRYHGGVKPVRQPEWESDAGYRIRCSVAAKRALAEHALRFLEPGSTAMLDESTTSLALARRLVGGPRITVATNFLDSMQHLGQADNVTLIGLGGEYAPEARCFAGLGCLNAIRALRVDILIASTTSMTAESAYHRDESMVVVKREMMNSAAFRVLLMDSTKVDQRSLHRLSDLTEWHVVLVDDRCPSAHVAAARAAGVHVEVVCGR